MGFSDSTGWRSRLREGTRPLIEKMRAGDAEAADRLYQRLERKLHRMASRLMRQQRPGHTLQTTALINEAWAKLSSREVSSCLDGDHFLAVAARAMRSVLIDHARTKGRAKRRATGRRVPLDDLVASYEERSGDLLDLDEALVRLREIDPQMADAVDLRFFGGLSNEKVASLLGLSLRTFERRWTTTRAWLRAELERS